MTVPRARIGEVLELRREPVVVKAAEEYRRIGIYSWGKGFLHRPPIPGLEMGGMRYFTIPSGALVLSNIQAWEAALGVSGETEDGHLASNRFLPYVPIDENRVSVRFLFHYFLSEVGLGKLRQASPGTQVRNRTLGKGLFEAIEVPLPEIDEQRRIAAHLDGIDRVRGCVVAVSDHSTAVSHALIEHAIQRLSRAHLRPLGELLGRERTWFEPENGKRYSPIGVRGFGRGLIRYPEISRDELPKLRFYPVNPERMIVSNIKAWEGAVALTNADDAGRVASNRFLQYQLTSDQATLPYVHQYLISREGLAQLQTASPGSADRNRTLSMEGFEAIRVPLPNLRVQGELLRLVDKVAEIGDLTGRRREVGGALLPAARNEIFSAMR